MLTSKNLFPWLLVLSVCSVTLMGHPQPGRFARQTENAEKEAPAEEESVTKPFQGDDDQQKKIVAHIKGLVNNAVAETEAIAEDSDVAPVKNAEEEEEESAVDTRADPTPPITTISTTTTTTTTTRRRTNPPPPPTTTRAPPAPEPGLLARIGSFVGAGVGNLGSNLVAGGGLFVAAASPLWAPFLLGKKKRRRRDLAVLTNEIPDHKPLEWQAKMIHTMIQDSGAWIKPSKYE